MSKANVIVDRFKTRPCRNFTTHGACPYEERCMFAHGDEELRTREMNIQQGVTTDEAVRAFQRNLRFQRQQQQAQQYQYHRQQQLAGLPSFDAEHSDGSEPTDDAYPSEENTSQQRQPDDNNSWDYPDSYNPQQQEYADSFVHPEAAEQQQFAGYRSRTIQYDGPAPHQPYYDNTCFCHDCNQARKAAGFYATYNYNNAGNSSAPCMCDECLAAQTDSSLTLTGNEHEQPGSPSPQADSSPKKQEKVVPLRPQPRPKKSALRMAFSP